MAVNWNLREETYCLTYIADVRGGGGGKGEGGGGREEKKVSSALNNIVSDARKAVTEPVSVLHSRFIC